MKKGLRLSQGLSVQWPDYSVRNLDLMKKGRSAKLSEE
jgi:hypothetical protein